MPKSSNQKLKLLYLMKILLERTDENHVLTVSEMIDELARFDVSAERKSIYDDLEALRMYGLDIESVKNKTTSYYIASRSFELPELKLLVDSVQSSKFITYRKSMELIKKIESFASHYDAQLLQRQVYVANRIKTMNESIYYNVDKIHNGIGQNKKITFKYFEYSISKERKFKRGGEKYTISPLALTWDNENYYMLGFDNDVQMIKHYRVDKMTDIDATEEKRDGLEEFAKFDMAVYSKKVFSMFGGSDEVLKLQFANELIGVVIDRFGKDISIMSSDESSFTVNVNVVVSAQFYGWLTSFGLKVKILSPESIVADYKNHIKAIGELYDTGFASKLV